MNKDDIIKNLCQQNQQLKNELNYWKNQYRRLEVTHKQLLETMQHNHLRNSPKKTSPADRIVQHEDTFIFDSGIPISTVSPSPEKRTPTSDIRKHSSEQVRHEEQVMVKSSKSTDDMFDFFSKDVHNPPQIDKSICELIEGCFIIQKNSSIDHFDPVRLVHPDNKYIKLRSMFDIIYRYVFVNDSLVEIHDDQFDSRKNQIMFGTPCEDFQFVFDNLSEKEGEKGRLNNFEKTTHIMRKRYAYGIVMPEIVEVGSQFFETEIAYGFLSHLPFPNFFKDLNRIVQQQIKFQMLNMKKSTVRKAEKIDLIGQIITHITNKSLQKNLVVRDYPVNLELKANICGLKLVYSNKNSYISDQFSHAETILPKFSLLKLIKILHYVLAEKNVIIVCSNRKKLNQIFEIIKIIIYPFNWIFPIIYFYTPFFEPFLNSPLPILIGHIESDHTHEEEERNSYKHLPLPQNDFIKVYAEEEEKQDQKQPQGFKKRIKKCYKKFTKDKKSAFKSEKHLSPLIDKSVEQRITCQIFSYIKKLREFIQTGKIEEEPDDFLIQFMETQMVSYYKEKNKELSGK